ncbi:type IV CRISPR-associated protein Csf1 [Rhodoferax antarcticus]|nr:type IV CRISPR-associated protein Csf1 [Rhodoferax antarcticus]
MSGTSISSSVIVSSGLGYKPEGVASKVEGVCSFCGLHIAKGDLASPFSVSSAFMDDISLAARGSGLTCGHCAPLMTATALRESGYGVFTKGGTQPFRKWVDIANAIRNPPNEPFVMAYATANNQHMGWRAPVNFSSALFYVRVGLRNLKIRHKYLMEAVDVSQVVGLAFGRESSAKTLAHPFVRLSSDLKEIGHAGLIVNYKPKELEDEAYRKLLAEHQDNIDFLMDLTLGETWALRFLLTPGAGSL